MAALDTGATWWYQKQKIANKKMIFESKNSKNEQEKLYTAIDVIFHFSI